MPSLFGDRQATHGGSQQATHISPRHQPLDDALTNAIMSQLLEPPTLEINKPLGQGISSLQSILAQVIPSAFGGGGMASRLAGGNPAPGVPIPSFGPAATRDDLGMGKPEVAKPGYLPTAAQYQPSVPGVRVVPQKREDNKLAQNLAGLEGRRDAKHAAGDDTTPWLDKRIAGLEKRQTKREAGKQAGQVRPTV